MTKNIAIRKTPEQQRSRETLEKILDAASSLFGSQGIESSSMTMIANAANMSKAALYRYFPNKHSLIKALAEKSFDEHRVSYDELLESQLDTKTLLDRELANFCQMHIEQPYLVQLRAAIHSDPVLAELDILDSNKNASELSKLIAEKFPRLPQSRRDDLAFLFVELVGSIARLCSTMEPENSHRLQTAFNSLFLNAFESSD